MITAWHIGLPYSCTLCSSQKAETEDLRHKILLFTYMRGGSSFLGSIFQSHPEAFYWFESLGPFYSQFLLENDEAAYNVWFDEKQTVR